MASVYLVSCSLDFSPLTAWRATTRLVCTVLVVGLSLTPQEGCIDGTAPGHVRQSAMF